MSKKLNVGIDILREYLDESADKTYSDIYSPAIDILYTKLLYN